MIDFEKYWEKNASKESWANKAVAWNIWKEQQAIIDNLKAQLNSMEACYIEKKKECDELQARANKALSVTGNYCDEDDAALLVFVLEKALRGAND